MAAYHILLATPPLMILAIIQGELPTISGSLEVQYLQHPDYTAVPPAFNCIHPTIYTIYLVDQETHEPPTVQDLATIIDSVRRKAAPIAVQVPAAAKALRLCRSLEARMVGQDPQAPIAGGLVDVGFSGDSAARIDQHLNDESSNKIMQLFYEAAVREFDDTYELQGYIVCKMRSIEHCALAEIIFSRMAQSYTSRGGGFNSATAGASIKRAHALSGVEWEEIAAVKPDWVFTDHFESDAVKMRAAI